MADKRAVLTVPAVLAAGLGVDLAVTLPLGRFAKQIRERRTSKLDKAGVKFVRSTESHALNRVMSVLSATAEPWALYPVAGLVATRWVAEDRRADAATLGLALVGSAGITKLLKAIVERPRPRFQIRQGKSSGSSFPSQHMAMSLATYGGIAYLVNRRRWQKRQGRRISLWIWAPVILLCTLIAWSRIYKGVHYPTDVLGGWAAGAIWLATCAVAGDSLGAEQR